MESMNFHEHLHRLNHYQTFFSGGTILGVLAWIDGHGKFIARLYKLIFHRQLDEQKTEKVIAAGTAVVEAVEALKDAKQEAKDAKK
jgi:hypothetical protein